MALFFYKEKNKDIRAAAYLRLSIEDGDKAESNSIGNQRELIRDFAAERPGLHLVEEYADDGYTGTNFERPGFKRMMEDIKSGKINCIIVKDLSRLGRNYIEMGKYLEQIFSSLRKAGLVRSVKGPQGGYLLAKRPESITVADVIHALDGSYLLEDERSVVSGTDEKGISTAIQKLLIDQMNDQTDRLLKQLTLRNLVDSSMEYSQVGQEMYYI